MMEKCLVCNDSNSFCAEGLFIQEQFLCQECFEMIAALRPEDIYYPFVKNSLKRIWDVSIEGRCLS